MFSAPPRSPSYGFVRLVPRIVPPTFDSPFTSCRVSGMKSPSTSPRHPSRIPTNSRSYEVVPLSTMPRMTALRPGQSPPLVRMPIFMLVPSDVREMGEQATLPSIDTSAPAHPGAIRAR